MHLSLWILRPRRLPVSKGVLAPSYWRLWTAPNVPPSTSLSVMLLLRRIIILCILLLKLASKLLNLGHLSPRLQLQLNPSTVDRLQICSTALQWGRIRWRLCSARGILLLFLGETLGPAMPRLHLPTARARIAIRRGLGKATVLTRRRRPIVGTSIRGLFTTLLLMKSLLVRWWQLVSFW